MTTYLLHGGRTSKKNALNEKFFSYFTEYVEKPEVVVLLCYFARETHEWGELINRDSHSISANSTKKVRILVAQNPKDLFEKLQESDVLYVAGGAAEPIEKLYADLAPLKEKLAGKVLAGSSMGAFLVSESYVLSLSTQEENSVHAGLGLLPVQTLCHWDVENRKQEKLSLLKKYSDSPILVLNEFETVILYK